MGWLSPRGRTFSGVQAYVLAFVATAAAVALTRTTWPFFARLPFAPLFAAVYVTARWGTEWAGIVCVGLGAVGSTLAFPAYGAFEVRAVLGFVLVSLIAAHMAGEHNRFISALQASEAQFRVTWEHAALGAALLNREGLVQRVNPALERILGHPASGVGWHGVRPVQPPRRRARRSGAIRLADARPRAVLPARATLPPRRRRVDAGAG